MKRKTKRKKKYRTNKNPKFFLRHLRGSGKNLHKRGGTKRKHSRVSNSRNTRGSSQSTGSSQSSDSMRSRGSSQSSESAQTSDSMRSRLPSSSKKKMRLKRSKHNNNNSLMQKQTKKSDIKINPELYKQIQKNGGLMQILLDMIGSSYNLAIFSGFLQKGTSFPYENSDGTKLYENEQSRLTDADPYICESSGRTRCSGCNLPPNFKEGLLFDGAHWKGYRVKNKTKKIFDSYKDDIQVKGTNNYCQSFATYLWTSEGNHNKKHNVTLLKGKYSKNIQVVSCLWQKLFTEIKSNNTHYMWYIKNLNMDIDLPYLKKPQNQNSTIIFDIVLRILQELCTNEQLARKFSTMRESNDSSELPELKVIFNL